MLRSDENFLPAGVDLQHSEPVDFEPNPTFTQKISSPGLREFGYFIHSIWPQLFRRVDPQVREHQQRHSLLALPHPIVVPGGRFRESYYWDSYWIVEGLLVSGLTSSARGVIKNLLSYIESFGFVPNGGRCYYMDRSQPPMLSEMVCTPMCMGIFHVECGMCLSVGMFHAGCRKRMCMCMCMCMSLSFDWQVPDMQMHMKHAHAHAHVAGDGVLPCHRRRRPAAPRAASARP